MSNFCDFVEAMSEEDMKFVEALLGPTHDVIEKYKGHFEKKLAKREECERNRTEYETDWLTINKFMEEFENGKKQSCQLLAELKATTVSTTYSEEKENTPTQPEISSSTSSFSTSGRPKRAAFREASQIINKQVNAKLKTKLRREDVMEEKSSIIIDIKTEKSSLKSYKDKEMNYIEEMPPPKSLPIKKRQNRRIKKERLDMSVILEDESTVDLNVVKQEKDMRNSDVVIQEPKISLVDLTISSSTVTTDNESNDDSKRDTFIIDKPIKTKQISEKRNRDVVVDDNVEKSLSKRPKSNPANDQNVDNKQDTTASTQYDDANSNIENVDIINATFVSTSPLIKETTKKKINETVVIQKHQQSPNIPVGLLTDDESDQEQSKQIKSTKQVFSAFEQSPVKKKVEAFEKLVSGPIVRVTRTKTKALEKQQTIQKQQNLANNSTKLLPVNNVKEKAKLFATTTPKNYQQTIKKTTNKTKLDETNQKEQDAKEKRDARMQQTIEERRRKREEKELKAQQQREIIEHEKMKQLEEQERLKAERCKRLLLEQEQRKQRQREEIERKRLLVKQKLQKQKEQTVEKPKYLTMETPRLPTQDCYDSDEDDYRKTRITVPNWCKEKNSIRFQFIMSFGGEKIKNAFFSRQAQTVDLKDLFQTNNPRILKRTSSAHWTKPPKFSILPAHLEDSFECSGEE